MSSVAAEDKVLNLGNLNPHIKTMEYAVRGPLVIRAGEIEKELKNGAKKPFTEVIKANIGDAHAMGQQPITFIRQVLALVSYPELIGKLDVPADVKAKANAILDGCMGRSAGSYSDSNGIEIIRKHAAEYIQRRDGGIPANPDNIILCTGASEGISATMKLFKDTGAGLNKPGVLIPIPQYPLYSATLAEFDLAQVGYYLNESKNWGLEVSELERSLEESKKSCQVKANANKWITNKFGLSTSEWINAIKMTANVVPVKSIPGFSQGSSRCRHCNEIETLGHILGRCPRGELLRNNRHHNIKHLLADKLRDLGWKVREEEHCTDINGTNRRCDILAYDEKSRNGFILDPTIRMESDISQPERVNQEKKFIYDPCIPFLKTAFNLREIETIGLYIGARGTITRFFVEFLRRFKIPTTIIVDIVSIVLKNSQVLPRQNIEEIIKFAHKHKLFIFADEVYQDNVYAEGSAFHSFKKVLVELGAPYSNSIELASFFSVSKGYMGECGLRGGYQEIVNVDPDVRAMLLKSISAKSCSTVLGQATMDCVVDPPKEGDPSYPLFIQEKTAVLSSLAVRAKMIAETFNSFAGFKCNIVQGAMYAFPQITLPQKAQEAAASKGQAPDVFYAFELLENTGICIVPGSGFGQYPGTFHFRTTILPQPEKLKVMLDKFAAFHTQFLEKYS